MKALHDIENGILINISPTERTIICRKRQYKDKDKTKEPISEGDHSNQRGKLCTIRIIHSYTNRSRDGGTNDMRMGHKDGSTNIHNRMQKIAQRKQQGNINAS